jgi:hypothetical protein
MLCSSTWWGSQQGVCSPSAAYVSWEHSCEFIIYHNPDPGKCVHMNRMFHMDFTHGFIVYLYCLDLFPQSANDRSQTLNQGI